MTPIRVFLTEDNADLGMVLTSVLDAYADIECVGIATSIPEVVTKAKAAAASVIVLDVEVKGESGLRMLPELMRELPGVEFVIFTGHDHPEMRKAALERGAAAFVVKSSEPEVLVDAIRLAAGRQAAAGAR